MPSQSVDRVYTVRYGHDVVESCTCPAGTYRPDVSCKHLIAVAVARAKRRGDTVRRLAALEETYERSLMDEDRRLEVRDAIVKMRRRLHA